jgi:hypothetical protein
MVVKVGVVFVLVVVVVLMFGKKSVNGHRQMIKSTKPKPPVKKGILRVVIAPTVPVNFKSISMSEQRPSIQVLKQHNHGRVLTLSFYEYKVLSPRGWFGPQQHPLDCVDTLYEDFKFENTVEYSSRLKKCISWMNNRGAHLYF